LRAKGARRKLVKKPSADFYQETTYGNDDAGVWANEVPNAGKSNSI